MRALEAFDILRNHALARVAQKLPVRWAKDGECYRAWLLAGRGWEQYYPREGIDQALQEADMFGPDE
jgi:hypothetical protein